MDNNTERPPNVNPLQAVIRFGDSNEATQKPKSHVKIRDPFDALQEAEKKQKSPEQIKQTSVFPDLKALLKKGGTFSLSEILQQKNLSLAELLTGSVKAISALTEAPATKETTKAVSSDGMKYQRMPPSERKRITNRVYEQSEESTESISSKEMLEAQRKRLNLLNGHKDNRLYLGITHNYEIVTEPITEKRIFIPSHPKHHSTVSFKPIMIQNTQRTPVITSTQTSSTKTLQKNENNSSESSNTVFPPFKRLPITSAKLITKITENMPVNKQQIYTIPPQAIKITIEDILKRYHPEPSTTNDEPLKITLDLNGSKKYVQPNHSVGNSNVSNEIPTEKLRIITAREELLEMLKDPTYKDRLSRILEKRNMTMQELVEQRERGSSQLHLADIFHNKTKEPEPSEEPFVGVIKGGYRAGLRQKKSRNLGEKEAKTADAKVSGNEAKLLSILQTTVEKYPTIMPTLGETTPDYGTNLNKSLDYGAILPFWKQFHPEIFHQLYQNGATNTLDDFDQNLIVDNGLSEVMNEKFGVDSQPKNYYLNEETFFDIPTGVKSALLASFAIVGLSLFMFLTILMIFKWTKKNKNKINYIGSLSGNKLKSPILEMPHKSALRTFMCETLGRKTNVCKTRLQSMSDVWDERKQKF
ncbi:hypothetical protein HHI36_010997 [Cryptolaemus montrouzieri]|uniref:Uncharacterized protein n=1 Tax=Cryptolaemus montrouzieri TaxID=559131 RepID=A0ABD2ML57_9CUCU